MVSSISSINGARVAPFSTISEAISPSNIPNPVQTESDSGGEQPAPRSRPQAMETRLEAQVAGQQRRRLAQDGQRMLAFRMLTGDLETMPELPIGDDSSTGMQAVMVAADEDNPTNISVKILQVDASGNSHEIYNTDSLESLWSGRQMPNLNLRGGSLDTYS